LAGLREKSPGHLLFVINPFRLHRIFRSGLFLNSRQVLKKQIHFPFFGFAPLRGYSCFWQSDSLSVHHYNFPRFTYCEIVISQVFLMAVIRKK
jgi:hypothetical protein